MINMKAETQQQVDQSKINRLVNGIDLTRSSLLYRCRHLDAILEDKASGIDIKFYEEWSKKYDHFFDKLYSQQANFQRLCMKDQLDELEIVMHEINHYIDIYNRKEDNQNHTVQDHHSQTEQIDQNEIITFDSLLVRYEKLSRISSVQHHVLQPMIVDFMHPYNPVPVPVPVPVKKIRKNSKLPKSIRRQKQYERSRK